MLTFEHSVIGYDQILFSVESLDLQPGTFYTLAGSNGLGKTTFFRSILGMVKLKAGKIKFSGNDLTHFSQQELAKNIAFVPSRFDGVQHLTGRQYLALGRAPYTNFIGKLRPIDEAKVDEVIAQLHLEKLADKDTSALSDGERQLLSIAKALVQEAPVMILDEPTAFLDYPNRIKILETLRKLAHEQGLCILQSSHDLDLSISYTDVFLLFQDKKLVCLPGQDTNKEEILAIGFQG